MKRLAAVLVLLLLAGCQPPGARAAAASRLNDLSVSSAVEPTAVADRAPVPRPNIVLITTDDEADDDMRWMPRTRRLLGRAGVTFRDSVSPHPLCCPARAEILTGQFAQNNGVRTNEGQPHGGFRAMNSYRDTIGPWLQAAGYRTAFVGKFLNGYRSTSPRVPGWNQWHPLLEDMGAYRYYDFATRDNDVVRRHPKVHVSDFIAADTARLVRRFAAQRRPFFIWQSHVAPHGACVPRGDASCWGPPVPAQRHSSMFEGVRPPSFDDPAFLEQDVADKPAYLKGLSTSSQRREAIRQNFVRRIQSLQSVDQAVARTIRVLRRTGELRNTVVLFTSDNGFLLGEHRWTGKDVPYEPSLQVPLLVRGPGLPRGVTRTATVATVDLAPTFVELAHARPTVPLDGRSLLGVARHRAATGWTSLLIQDGRRLGERPGVGWSYRGVRTPRYTYVEYSRYGSELYDRRLDPHQLTNVAGRLAYRAVERELRRRAHALRGCSGRGCRRDFGPLPRRG
jgi:arylsulfatase A-like enzyme